jgi:hypothetical protein
VEPRGGAREAELLGEHDEPLQLGEPDVHNRGL